MKNDNKKITLKFDNISKSPDENIIIGDHSRIMFVLSPEKRKITIFAKPLYKEDFLNIQKRFINFGREKGIIVPGTESTGYIPGTFEFTYPESNKADSIKIMLKFIHMFLQQEKEIISKLEQAEQDFEERLLQPSDEESTELGEVPHEEKKGGQTSNPYMNYINAWFGWYI